MRSVMLVVLVLLSACAQSPNMVLPAYVSPVIYRNWSCEQLSDEQARLSAALATASQQQEATRSNDVAGMIFLGLPLASMSGGNVAPLIARYKGEQEAAYAAAVTRPCIRGAVWGSPPPA